VITRAIRRVRALWRRSGARCAWRGRCSPVKHPLGGYRCAVCRVAGSDYGDFDSVRRDAGYVSRTRRVFSRANGGELTRTDAWSEGRRGW